MSTIGNETFLNLGCLQICIWILIFYFVFLSEDLETHVFSILNLSTDRFFFKAPLGYIFYAYICKYALSWMLGYLEVFLDPIFTFLSLKFFLLTFKSVYRIYVYMYMYIQYIHIYAYIYSPYTYSCFCYSMHYEYVLLFESEVYPGERGRSCNINFILQL